MDIKNNIYKESGELFNFTAKTITLIDFLYIITFYFTSQNPWLSITLVLAFPILNVPTVKLSILHNKNYIDYTLTLTLIPLFYIGYFSGADAPGWLPAFSLLAAIEMLVLNNKYKIFLKYSVLLVTAFASLKAGKDIESIIIIILALLIFMLLISSILTYIVNLLNTLQESKKEIEKAHKSIKDSINFASLIQGAILPNDEIIEGYTKDSFALWQPKDIIGGDIYFITELDSKKEILIMVIDGAGHGVPGAFVTMLVKAVETQIIAELKAGTLSPSPALIMEYFNRSIKTMLKQEKGSRSNAGFDGGIIYYNKATNECIYAGAKTDLYIINDNNLEIVKGDKKNVGFVRTKIDQKYTDNSVEVKKGTKLYIATDGIYDQEGVNKSRYGIDKFEKLILDINDSSFDEQKDKVLSSFNEFKQNFKQSDDLTVVGLKF